MDNKEIIARLRLLGLTQGIIIGMLLGHMLWD
jgi:hypothetical protein